MSMKTDRVVTIIQSMSDEERRELIEWMQDNLCDRCAAHLPDEAAWEKHDCPFPPICMCGHHIDEHDEEDEDGKCLAKGEDGKRCDCPGFEEDDEDEDEDEEEEGDDS